VLSVQRAGELWRCAFTRVPYGTDVDFGELTKATFSRCFHLWSTQCHTPSQK
jgi:hypothetical protein